MKRKLLITFVFSGILTIFYSWYHARAMGYFTLSMELTSVSEQEEPILQLFYDIGSGFREHDSHSFLLEPEEKSQKIVYTIPSNVIFGIRLDYLNMPGSVLLKSMEFTSSSDDPTKSILISENTRANQTLLKKNGNGTVLLQTTPPANDPYIVLPFQEPMISSTGHFALLDALFGAKIFCALFAGIGLIFLFSGTSPEKEEKGKR